ncbi:response regulator [Aestuariispira insulae]|uniref:Response regulator receiver domain-containing protein n=1 Tax=Aestuariispira insulae TaxID=1461337 RepID=A0A3D9H2R5_9PROT|nr:response regulator [Aestuariispira insulae]RED43803.1 response regulator receiver domain-containing protein [Aestuariispira insulae]
MKPSAISLTETVSTPEAMMDKTSILIVDDSPSSLALMAGMLEDGYCVATALSAEEAKRQVDEGPRFDILICDLMLGAQNGLDLAADIQGLIPHIATILVTGNASLESAQAAIRQGKVHRYLNKGGELSELLYAVEDCALLAQRQKIEAEVLERTLTGFVAVLFETLTSQLPNLKPKCLRLQELVNHLVDELKPEKPWQIRLAGSLLWIGFLKVPHGVMDKVSVCEQLSDEEWHLFNCHAHYAREMLRKMPQLAAIGDMVESAFQLAGGKDKNSCDRYGPHILKFCHDAVWLMEKMPPQDAATILMASGGEEGSPIKRQIARCLVDHLMGQSSGMVSNIVRLKRRVSLLLPGDRLAVDLKTLRGQLLLPKGQALTCSTIDHLKSLLIQERIEDNIEILRKSVV